MTQTKAAVEKAFQDAVKDDQKCAFARYMDESEFGDVIRTKVADETHYSAAVIAKVLKGIGFPVVSAKAISAHRRNECRCR